MNDLVKLRRFQPNMSHPRPMMWRSSGMSSNYFDDPYYMDRRYNRHQMLPPISYRNYIDPIFEPPVTPYPPFGYPRLYTPTLIEDDPYELYDPCETPVEHYARAPPANNKKVYLPKHAEKLVDRFLNSLEQAHGHQNTDGNESDCSLDDCDACRRLQTIINEKSDLAIPNRKHQDDYVHVIETVPTTNNNNKPPLVTTTQFNTVPPNPIPNHMPLYPVGHNTFMDPNTGFAYTYDPSWQYNSPYYNNPVYMPGNPPFGMYNTTSTAVHDSTNPVMDKATYTRIASDDRKHKADNKTVIVHTSRNATPPTPKIIVEQPHRHRRGTRRVRSRTIVKERTTHRPHARTTTYTST